jgi:hypothetical protein
VATQEMAYTHLKVCGMYLINVTIRWWYTCRSHWQEASEQHVFSIMVSSFYCGIQSKYKTKPITPTTLKTLNKFKVVPKDVYGSLPTMRKALNIISVT